MSQKWQIKPQTDPDHHIWITEDQQIIVFYILTAFLQTLLYKVDVILQQLDFILVPFRHVNTIFIKSKPEFNRKPFMIPHEKQTI